MDAPSCPYPLTLYMTLVSGSAIDAFFFRHKYESVSRTVDLICMTVMARKQSFGKGFLSTGCCTTTLLRILLILSGVATHQAPRSTTRFLFWASPPYSHLFLCVITLLAVNTSISVVAHHQLGVNLLHCFRVYRHSTYNDFGLWTVASAFRSYAGLWDGIGKSAHQR